MSAATGLRRRMINPDVFVADDLDPLPRRFLFLGLMALAEDSGCLPWGSPAMFRAIILPYETSSIQDVQEDMNALVASGRVIPYTIGDREYAFLPDFPRWQASLTRWLAPRMVPLPSWIGFTPDDAPQRTGSGTYAWPPQDLELNSINEKKELNEPANTLLPASHQTDNRLQAASEEDALGMGSTVDSLVLEECASLIREWSNQSLTASELQALAPHASGEDWQREVSDMVSRSARPGMSWRTEVHTRLGNTGMDNERNSNVSEPQV